MKAKLIFELVIGIIGLCLVLYFGIKGSAFIALLAFHPFVGKDNPLLRKQRKKWDEREFQLFYRTGNYTAGLTILGLVIMFYYRNQSVNSFLINDLWLPLSASIFLIAHGVSGIIMLKKY